MLFKICTSKTKFATYTCFVLKFYCSDAFKNLYIPHSVATSHRAEA